MTESRPRRLLRTLALGLLLLGPLTACRAFTKEAADEEVYGILEERRPCVPEIAGSLDVDAADRVSRAARCSETYRLPLNDALALAAAASRDYLGEREDVYLAAEVLEVLLVTDAETLLLVDDDQAQVPEGHVTGEQPMGADDDIHLPASEEIGRAHV